MASKLNPYDISTKEARTDLIVSYVPYVNSIASAVSKQFSCPEVEDLRSSGYQGLLEAVNNFNPDKNVAFKYYAYIRIYGHMIDYMRKLYAGANATVAMKRKINKILEKGNSENKVIDSEKIATELGITLKEYQKMQNKINNTTFVLNFTDLSNDDNENFNASKNFFADNGTSSDDLILVEQLWKIMKDKFPEREKQIMELIYVNELTYPEIAKQFDITDRRVSQLHLSCLSKLRKLVKYGRHTKLPEHRNRSKKTVGV